MSRGQNPALTLKGTLQTSTKRGCRFLRVEGSFNLHGGSHTFYINRVPYVSAAIKAFKDKTFNSETSK